MEMPQSSAYWTRRKAKEMEWIEQNLKNDEMFNRLIQKHYDKLLENINKDIANQYIKYAGREGMTISDAKQVVSRHDVEAFSTEAKSVVEEARKIFKEKGAVAYSDFSAGINQRLRLYNATMRVNRLEYLKAQIGMDVMKTNIDIGSELAQSLKDGYISEWHRQAGILGETLNVNDLKDVAKVVMAQTQNANFSERLWGNSDVLKSNLDGLLTQQYIQGINPKVIATKLKPLLANAVKNARYVTERLARTESARVATTAQLNSFNKYGYNHVRWVAEPSACKVCLGIELFNDGVYPTKDVPAIPVHANCRCSISAWVDGMDLNPKEIEDNSIQETQLEDVESANQIQNVTQFKNYMVKNLGFENVGTGSMTPEVMQTVAKAFSDVYKEYPQLKGFIRTLDTKRSLDAIAEAGIRFDKNTLSLETRVTINSLKIKNTEQVKQMIDYSVQEGWWTQKNDAGGVIKHELAHMLEYRYNMGKVGISNINDIDILKILEMFDGINSDAFSIDIRSKAFKKFGIRETKKAYAKYISEYGASDAGESIAEAFSDESDNEVTAYIRKLIKEAMDSVN